MLDRERNKTIKLKNSSVVEYKQLCRNKKEKTTNYLNEYLQIFY